MRCYKDFQITMVHDYDVWRAEIRRPDGSFVSLTGRPQSVLRTRAYISAAGAFAAAKRIIDDAAVEPRRQYESSMAGNSGRL
jgi:hypothetical protein